MCCCRPVAGHDYPGHGVPERGGQAGHPQGQAHPTHPPLQGEANTSNNCQRHCWGSGIQIEEVRIRFLPFPSGSPPRTGTSYTPSYPRWSKHFRWFSTPVLGLPDPDLLVRGTDPVLSLFKRVTPKDRHILHTLQSKVMQTLSIIVNAIVGDPGSRTRRYGSGSFPFQAGHYQGQAHPPHPPGQGEATTSDNC